MNDELRILYDNSQIWLFAKPAGIATQGGKGIKTSFEDVISQELYEKPYLVHRLDKETAGILLVAKNSSAASRYSQYFKKNDVEKYYKAIVFGRFPSKMEIRDELIQHGKKVEAHTSAKLISHHGAFSLISLRLHTGRMHQIRLHLQKKGYPIVGDDKYGDFTLNRFIKKSLDLDNLMLYANHLIIKQEKLDINLELPFYFEQFLRSADKLKDIPARSVRPEKGSHTLEEGKEL